MRWWHWIVLVVGSWVVGATLGLFAVIRMDGVVTDLEKRAEYSRRQATVRGVR